MRMLAGLLAALVCSCSARAQHPDGAQASAVRPRAEAGDGTVRFLAVGDTGMGNAEQLKVAAAMAKTCAARGCDFVLLLGDNIYQTGVDSADDPQWRTKFEEPYAALQLPFYATLGNHDYGGLGNDFARPEGELAYARRGGRFKLPARRYHFVQGPAEFFSLDTNAARWQRDPEQTAEVAGWMAASKAPWKIAFSHFPYLSNGPHGNAGAYEPARPSPLKRFGTDVIGRGAEVKALLDAAVCGKADLYLSGHDHSIQWLSERCGGSTELIVSGAGAEATQVSDRNPVHFQAAALGFVYLVASAAELTAELVDAEGKTWLARTLRKAPP